MSKFGLGPPDRIRRRREIDAVFTEGKKVVGPDVIVWFRRRPSGEAPDDRPRLAVVVSKKLGTAVRRNRVKRLVRESFRLNKGELERGVDVIVYPRPGCRWTDFREAEQAIRHAWDKAGISTHRGR